MFTKNIPTEDGYYWIKLSNERPYIVELVEQDTRPFWPDNGYKGLHVILAYGEYIEPIPMGTDVEYSGPLIPPVAN